MNSIKNNLPDLIDHLPEQLFQLRYHPIYAKMDELVEILILDMIGLSPNNSPLIY